MSCRHSYKHDFLLFLLLLLLLVNQNTPAQSEIDKWDNQFYVGNKVSWGKDQWRFTGELQIRLEDNMQTLERWFLETSASYLINKPKLRIRDF